MSLKVMAVLYLVPLFILGCSSPRSSGNGDFPPPIPLVERVSREQLLPGRIISDVTLRAMNRDKTLPERQRDVQSLLYHDAKSWTEADFKRFLEDVLRRPELWADLGLGGMFVAEKFWEERSKGEDAAIIVESVHRDVLPDGSVRWSAKARIAADSLRNRATFTFHHGRFSEIYMGPVEYGH